MKKLLNSLFTFDYFVNFFIFLSVVSVYIHHLSPSIYGFDSGDFTSAIITKGIPHPSGYPLYTMLGIIANSLPFNQTVAWKVGIVSAIFSAVSVVLVYLITKLLVNNKLISLIVSFTIAFFYPFWLYAEVVEVFALHVFFVILLLYVGICFYLSGKRYYLFLIAFVAGLSLTNNLSVLLIFPSIFILIMRWWREFNLKKIFYSTTFFVLGLLPYLYLPIAALNNPEINSVGEVTIQNFFRVVLRSDYGWKLESEYTFSTDQVNFYLSYLITELRIAVLALVAIGFAHLIHKGKILITLTLFTGFLFTGPIFFTYSRWILSTEADLGILERFFIVPSVILLFFVPFGIQALTSLCNAFLKKIMKRLVHIPANRSYSLLIILIFLLLPYSIFIKNNHRTDFHDVWIGNNLGNDVLKPLPLNSIVILYSDTPVFNASHMQFAYNFRQDVFMPSDYRYVSKYLSNHKRLNQEKINLKNKFPEIDNQTLLLLTLNKFRNSHSVFYLFPIQVDKKYSVNVEFIPYGVLWKLASDKDLQISQTDFEKQQQLLLNNLQFREPESKYDPVVSSNYNFLNITSIYAQAYLNTGNYLRIHYMDSAKANAYEEKAYKFNPLVR